MKWSLRPNPWMPIYRLLHNNPRLLTVLSIVAIERWLQKLSVVSHLSATGRGVGYLSHLPKSVFKTSRIAALGTRITCYLSITIVKFRSCPRVHVWARYGIGVHRAHAQLNRFYLESTLCITCVTSRTRPSSHFFACNIKKLGERAWGRG